MPCCALTCTELCAWAPPACLAHAQRAWPGPQRGPDALRLARRWMATERTLRLVLQKLAVVRWDRLVAGERLASISVDWSQWMDEEEELAVRQHPLGHNAAQMNTSGMAAAALPRSSTSHQS